MPVILLERIPLPSLQTYTSVSVLVLSVALYYAYHTVTTVDINSIHELDFGDGVTVEPVADDEVLNEHHDMVNISLPYDSVGWNMFHILTSEVWCVWVGNTCIYRSTNSQFRGTMKMYEYEGNFILKLGGTCKSARSPYSFKLCNLSQQTHYLK